MRCCLLSPWLGGGFGMFSTVDAREVRVLRVDGAVEREVGVPRFLADEADRAATLPTDARLRALARAMAAHPDHPGAVFRIEVWETRFAPSGDAALARRPERLRALVAPPAAPPRGAGAGDPIGRR